MKKTLLTGIFSLAVLAFANAQVYTADLSQIDNGKPGYWGDATTGMTATFTDANKNSVTVTRLSAGTNLYESMSYGLNDDGTPTTVDMSGTGDNKIYVIARSASANVKLRVDVKDENNYVSNLNGAKTGNLTSAYAVYTFTIDFRDGYSGGHDADPCVPSEANPCTVDATAIKELLFSINDGASITSDLAVDIKAIQIGGTAPVLSGVKNQSSVANLSVSPNPASDLAVVNYSAPSDAVVTVSDLKGNVVKTVNGSNTSASINTTDLTSGMYVVTVAVDGVPSTPQKLVVK